MFRKISILILGTVLVLGNSCKKKGQVQDNIAYQTVNLNIYPNDPLYNTASGHTGLGSPGGGGWAYVGGGVNGIVVYRKNATDFVAIERTSTYYPDDSDARVKVQSDNFTLKDTISGSKWQIVDGAIMSGPATLPLRLYNTLYDNGTGTLHISN